MYRYLLTLTLVGAIAPTTVAACEALGMKSEYLSQQFCKQLEDISNSESETRSITGSDTYSETKPFPSDWPDIKILQDAYRADPRKTLELIRRIKNAGGLTSE